MVNYAYSYLRLRTATGATLWKILKEVFGYRGVVGASAENVHAAYDSGPDGAAAPHTDWISVCSLRDNCKAFSQFSAKLESIDQEATSRRCFVQKLCSPVGRFDSAWASMHKVK